MITAKKTIIRNFLKNALSSSDYNQSNIFESEDVIKAKRSKPKVSGGGGFEPENLPDLTNKLSSMASTASKEKLKDIYNSAKDILANTEDSTEPKEKEEETKMNKQVESKIRKEIRKIISEIAPQRYDTYGTLDPTYAESEYDDDEQEAEANQRSRKNVMMTDVSGASFEEIAAELGFAGPPGAKKFFETTLAFAANVGQNFEPNDLELIQLLAANDWLVESWELEKLSLEDKKFLLSHITDHEGFREVYNNWVHHALDVKKKVEASGQDFTLYLLDQLARAGLTSAKSLQTKFASK